MHYYLKVTITTILYSSFFYNTTLKPRHDIQFPKQSWWWFRHNKKPEIGAEGVHGSNKVNFLGSKFGGTQKVVGKIS